MLVYKINVINVVLLYYKLLSHTKITKSKHISLRVKINVKIFQRSTEIFFYERNQILHKKKSNIYTDI